MNVKKKKKKVVVGGVGPRWFFDVVVKAYQAPGSSNCNRTAHSHDLLTDSGVTVSELELMMMMMEFFSPGGGMNGRKVTFYNKQVVQSCSPPAPRPYDVFVSPFTTVYLLQRGGGKVEATQTLTNN